MARVSDLVHETSTTTGTGNLTVSAVDGKRTFNTAFGQNSGDDFNYFIVNRSAAEWEIGTGYMSDSTTLVRNTVKASSNSDAAVSFSAGTKDVVCDQFAEQQSQLAHITYPLVDYGGYNFDGSTDYLDANALTGITDTKKGSFVGIIRFANSASSTEEIMRSTGLAFAIRRLSTGVIQVLGENSSGTGILDIRSEVVCSAAETYVIMMSWDLATSSSAKIWIDNTENAVTETTFTNDTIDYTVAEYAIGSFAGANKFSGDIYYLWFDETVNLDFDDPAVRRRFTDVNNVPIYPGETGQLCTGSQPRLFLGLDSSSSWHVNKGSATGTFTENGTAAAASTGLDGQYMQRT